MGTVELPCFFSWKNACLLVCTRAFVPVTHSRRKDEVESALFEPSKIVRMLETHAWHPPQPGKNDGLGWLAFELVNLVY
jgi:hypothetical protein